MKRRTFIAGLGSAAAWPPARAQQGDRMRRIGVLMPGDEDDRLYKSRVSAFTQPLAGLRIPLAEFASGDRRSERR